MLYGVAFTCYEHIFRGKTFLAAAPLGLPCSSVCLSVTLVLAHTELLITIALRRRIVDIFVRCTVRCLPSPAATIFFNFYRYLFNDCDWYLLMYLAPERWHLIIVINWSLWSIQGMRCQSRNWWQSATPWHFHGRTTLHRVIVAFPRSRDSAWQIVTDCDFGISYLELINWFKKVPTIIDG